MFISRAMGRGRMGGGVGWGGVGGLLRGEEMAWFFCLPDAIRHQHEAGACVLLVCV